jgi:hypothetical protein
MYLRIYVYRFKNIFLHCPTPRLHCFLSFHWPSFRFLSFMPFLILSIHFFFLSSSCYLLFRHTMPKPSDDIARQALEWNPQGQRGRGRPRNTWRRTVLKEAKTVKKTWMEIKPHANNRVRWRNLVEALCWGCFIYIYMFYWTLNYLQTDMTKLIAAFRKLSKAPKTLLLLTWFETWIVQFIVQSL